MSDYHQDREKDKQSIADGDWNRATGKCCQQKCDEMVGHVQCEDESD